MTCNLGYLKACYRFEGQQTVQKWVCKVFKMLCYMNVMYVGKPTCVNVPHNALFNCMFRRRAQAI